MCLASENLHRPTHEFNSIIIACILYVHPTLCVCLPDLTEHLTLVTPSLVEEGVTGWSTVVVLGSVRSTADMTSTTMISALHEKYSNSSMQSSHCQIFITSKAPGKTGECFYSSCRFS